jgi:tetratricopeptide (TPR) repeat protein
LVTIAAVVAAAAGVETRARNRDYASEEALWHDTVMKDPGNQRAHVAYGSALAANGRTAEAQKEFEAAVALDPSDAVAQGRLGHVYGLARQDALAVDHLQRAHDLRPGDSVVTTELAGILADSRDPTVRNPGRALPLADEAVRLSGRRDAAALEVLAVAHAYLGHGGQAVSLMEEAVAVARRAGDPRLIELEQRLAFYRSRTAGVR